jgi:penicillin-binding protein 2
LAYYARAFGLGEVTGLDPAREKAGLIPTSSWKKKRFADPWQLGETLSVAIGQSYNLVTPIQQFVMISTVANGGRLIVPRVVQRAEAANGRVVATFEPKDRGKVPVSAENLRIVCEALAGVVQDPRGTGKRARVDGVEVAGKTGTAQVIAAKEGDSSDDIPYELRDHAWFICFAPKEAPQIAVVVLVEHGGHGGAAAAPVAKQILEAFFKSGGPEG